MLLSLEYLFVGQKHNFKDELFPCHQKTITGNTMDLLYFKVIDVYCVEGYPTRFHNSVLPKREIPA